MAATSDAELLPFVDGHVHFWELDDPELDWGLIEHGGLHSIIGDLDGVRVKRFSAREFEAQSRFQNVVGVVHVQAAFGTADPVAETAWVDRIAAATGIPHAIVGTADLAMDDVEAELERHAEYGRLRGLRGFADLDVIESEQWQRGYALLERYGLVYAQTFGVGSFGAARALAERHPGITLCIDQSGMPLSRTDEYFHDWRKGIREAARSESTVCKVASLGMVDQRWTVASLRPWILSCIDAFGPQRVYFGSNWPMDSVASSYPDLISAFREIVSEHSLVEQRALLAGNAQRLFGLRQPADVSPGSPA